MSAPPVAPAAHVPALDGWRAVAAGLVVLHHLDVVLPGPRPGWVATLAANGWMGVDLFFVLSGFLITGILLRTAGRPRWLRNFWIRRALRILPLCYGVIALIVVPAWLAGLEVPFPPWVGFAFLTNFWLAEAARPDVGLVVLWSLSVEEQFYAVWPWGVRALGRRGLLVAIVAMLVAAPLLRLAALPGAPAMTYYATWCRMDALGWGALAAWLVHARFDRVAAAAARLAPVVALAGLAAGVLTVWDRTTEAFVGAGYSILALGSTVVVLGLASGRDTRLARLLRLGPVVYVGQVSYGLYLLHSWVFTALKGPLGATVAKGSWPVIAAIDVGASALAVGLAGLVYRLIEAPILSYKDVLAPTSPPPSTDTAPARAA